MDDKEFGIILQEGEGLKIEFKESFDFKRLSKEIVAFANANGGKIFLGVGDDGKIKGIKQGYWKVIDSTIQNNLE